MDESYLAWALPSFSWRFLHVFPRFSSSHLVWRAHGYFSRHSLSHLLELFGIFITKSVRNLVSVIPVMRVLYQPKLLLIHCDHLGNLGL